MILLGLRGGGRFVRSGFGAGRFAKTAERLREGNEAMDELSFVALDGNQMVASVRFWPITIGVDQGLLLGPLAVDPARRGAGIGLRLMEIALQECRQSGHRHVILVGDEPYYAKVGFAKSEPNSIIFPGPVDPARLLWLDLSGTTKQSIAGAVTALRDTS